MKKYKNIATGKIAGQGQAKFILNKKFIAELIAHTCHQPGLSIVYNELLSFEGDEIHMREVKELAGKSFKQILQMFEDSSIIGISSGEKVKLNPPMDTIFKAEDKIIAVSASDTSIIISEKPDNYHFKEDFIKPSISKGASVQNILILGWNDSGKIIIDELNNYVPKDTRITVMANLDNIEKIFDDYVQLEFIKGDTTDYDFLQEFILREYSHVVVLGYHDIDVQEADSITLMTLIHLRDIAEKNNKNFSITSEILDIQNRELAKVAKVNDFIVSEKLTSLFLAQLSENEFLNPVFEDLLSDYGSEIYLKNIKNYVVTDVEMNFYTVIEAASRKNDVAIGYKIASEESVENKNFGIYINPNKSSMIKFSDKDNLIVLSEDIF
ncbi:MAG: NAD-binding protein [Actinobacteria bacterium]|nr:NAD-binding protein [Actinomycetota bacterium]